MGRPICSPNAPTPQKNSSDIRSFATFTLKRCLQSMRSARNQICSLTPGPIVMHTTLRGLIAGIGLWMQGTILLVLPGGSQVGWSDFDILYCRSFHQPGRPSDAPLTDPFAGGFFIPERPIGDRKHGPGRTAAASRIMIAKRVHINIVHKPTYKIKTCQIIKPGFRSIDSGCPTR